ncbi:hypothetical protein A2662_01890 [Candidatus Giovannonibacteria bacterium RIFCSPHIGHO2_01_FULL_45_33]|uniref:DUF3137 domain-containing protein n=1 Tax=Candidatus Giovannonibacteria bacterium RIFCSPLOWO2_01_FULL_45_34 TaxID=1798351 RepID=A0A1F5WZG5_9BACT|nr:MAG: hypothetical protein A2662_01890 [Candidatus Giovannonibacteria bacterium RIFCSPHIGHO2_01_FULL_45_33]OGF69042.1 MAG: hypothetical protein A3C73_00760 [Candidatus Giovannonibacteria bacterium RIFCSPHIGHO2_02_FULL_44_11]OGF81042.1 MAG: hypothetical protein A2930_03230 [Candidatus Giovannonibacteria bacterium RIFCSPLOWO2_01_FULL_45_34]
MADFFELNLVDDVNKSAHRYIKERWGGYFIVPAILLPVFAVFEAYYFGEPRIFLIAAVIWVIGGFAWAYSVARKEFMRQFAKANGLNYVGGGNQENLKGNLFKKGNSNSRKTTHLVEGEKGGYKLGFFFYSYDVGSGDSKRTYEYSVCEIFFKGHAPDIVIESRSDWDFISYAADHQKEMPVEGFFKEHFGVYVPEDFEIETLEIFTPDVMAYLIDHAKKYNFEFIEDRLYIFKQGFISKRAELQEFFTTANYLVEKLAPRIFRLHDDVSAMKELRGK